VLGVPGDEDAPKQLVINVRDVDVPAGAYILALRDSETPGEYTVVPIPSSPGFPRGTRRAPVYPATESTRMQAREALRQFQKALGP